MFAKGKVSEKPHCPSNGYIVEQANQWIEKKG